MPWPKASTWGCVGCNLARCLRTAFEEMSTQPSSCWSAWAGVLASALAGLFIIDFESVEVAVIDRFGESWLLVAVVLQAVYIALGLVIFGLSTFLWMAEFLGQHFAARHANHS
jgi:uncharacterized membrane protein YoaT (DUF817 family)